MKTIGPGTETSVGSEGTSAFKDRFIKISLIFLTIAYAWVFAFELEPHPRVSSKVASGIFWLEKGQIKEWQKVSRHRPRAVALVAFELSRLAGQIDTLGGYFEPPALLINADTESVYKVDAKRIEISENIILSQGQVLRAFIKAWLLQKARPEINASLLRTTVVSDALSAMILNEDEFEAPNQSLKIPEPENWLSFARSYRAFCHSPWTALEISRSCGESETIEPLSFRPLLVGMIWSVYLNTYPIERMAFLRNWALSLRDQEQSNLAATALALTAKVTPRYDPEKPQILTEWKSWIDVEFSKLLPKQVFAQGTDQRWAWETARENARVRPTSSFVIDFSFYRTMDVSAPTRATSPTAKPILVSSRDVTYLYPGQVRLQTSDLKGLRSRWLVWQSCPPSNLGEVLDSFVPSERILYVQSCASDNSKLWSALMFSGIKGFARAQGNTAFVEMNREQLDMALARGELSRKTPLGDLMEQRSDRKYSLLGLEEAEWRKDVKAYHVLGAIEAIEWFRSPTPKAGI